MEVLPSSNVQCGGESGFPQQDSGSTYIYDGNMNCSDHTEVQVMDVQVNDLTHHGEGSHFEQGGDKWTIAESSTSEGHDNDDSLFEYEVDGQKFSSDSHDSAYSEDQCTRGSLAYENSQLHVETIMSELPSSSREEAPWLAEVKWPEPEEAMAVWVKWRGMWQAGIQCARADWPLATLKAKPTHDRKKYLVVFFPRRRNYSWADVLLVRPINEFPEPIPYRTHKVGAKMVKDLTVARRFIIQKLAVGIINIIDQLHSEALIESARNVAVWKEFAMEASHCRDYSDIGRLLLELQSMIASCCFDSLWIQHSLESWVHRCKNANSAECVELLKEELVDSILWNEVNSLSNGVTQNELNFEWKTWKQEIMKSFSVSHPIASGRDIVQPSDASPLGVELQTSRKRPKLVVRRAEANASHADTQCQSQSLNTEINNGFMYGRNIVDGATSENKHPAVEAPPMGADRWGEIVIEAGNTEIIQTKDVTITPTNGVATRPFNSGSKSNQCAAYIESKGRQCVRWANDGDVYCCVHLASRFGGHSPNLEASPSDAILCGGTTVLGTKCKHRALTGTPFCKKHRPQNDEVTMPSTPNSKKRKYEESIHKSESTSCKDIVLVGQSDTPLPVDPVSFASRDGSNEKSVIKMPEQSSKENSGTELLHCIGPVSEEANGTCLESPKKHFLYCEKHLPSWLKRARNGKTRIVSKEIYMDLLRECYSWEQKLHLHHACELFHRLFKSILSLRNPVPKEIQIQWAITEASKDASVGELLMKLVLREKDRLEKLWGFTADKDSQNCSSVEDPVALPITLASDSGPANESEIKCKICLNNFCNDQSLGEHWMDNHKKEAQWLFRGYACAICLDSFTNKKILESHVQERHHAKFVAQCLLLQCIPCGNHFGNADELWLHVLSLHTSSFKLPSPSQQHDAVTLGEDSAHKLEADKSVSVENINTDNQGVARKFICKFCGLKFDLLPDLGRHHQAAHMGANPVASHLPKRSISFYAYKLKAGRLGRPRFKKSKGAASYKIRNRAGATMKKRIQLSSSINAGELKDQIRGAEADKLGGLVEFQCSNVAKMLYSEITKTKPRPSNVEILSFARSACCKVKLQNLLEEKYGILPERLYLKAAKLCSEHNIVVYWHQDGFICSNQCKRITVQHPVSPLLPLPDESRSRSALPLVSKATEWEVDECHCIVDSQHFKQEPIMRTIILCDDISSGEEAVPIACVVDEILLGSLPILMDGSNDQSTTYSMPWEGFKYVRKPLVDRSLAISAESLQIGCACVHSTCSSETCDHVYLFDNDFEDAKDKCGKPMKGRFPYDDKGRIILEEGYMVYECNQNCHCSRSCKNRVLQNGVQVKLEVYRTEKKGWAVRACEQILHGTFVCEYIGEVIDEQEATIRRKRYSKGCDYLYEIDAHSNDMSRLIEEQDPYVIDATTYGNVSRYINHSCLPNLTNHQVLVESMDCQLSHIGLYASRDIAIGEELTYDYRYKQLSGEGCPCLCGAPNCKGRLY